MSDFCRQCAIKMGFPGPHNDLMPETDCGDLILNEGFQRLCEGCGPCLVDYAGQCIKCPEPGSHPVAKPITSFKQALFFEATIAKIIYHGTLPPGPPIYYGTIPPDPPVNDFVEGSLFRDLAHEILVYLGRRPDELGWFTAENAWEINICGVLLKAGVIEYQLGYTGINKYRVKR
jgi:hypothetical protein